MPTELSLGVVAINGIPLPLVGTHSTISKICQRWIRMQPGIEKKIQSQIVLQRQLD